MILMLGPSIIPSDESQTDECSNQPCSFEQDTQRGLGMLVMLGEPLPINIAKIIWSKQSVKETDWYHSKGTPQ